MRTRLGGEGRGAEGTLCEEVGGQWDGVLHVLQPAACLHQTSGDPRPRSADAPSSDHHWSGMALVSA